MRTSMAVAALAVSGLACALAASAAQAVVIVQYSQIGRANTFHVVNTGSNFTVGIIGTPIVTVTLNDPFSNASMTTTGRIAFTGTGTAIATIAGSSAVQSISSGSFSVTTAAPITFGSFTGTNILSASFSNGFISATLGTRTPQVSVNVPIGTFSSISSDFFADPRLNLTDMSITTSGANPLIALIAAGGGNQKLRNFQSASTGTFDASVVPEPASWALLLIGFTMVGVSVRRRKQRHVVA